MLVVALLHSQLGQWKQVCWFAFRLTWRVETTVGSECGGPTGLLLEDLWPRNWCSDHSALVTGSRTNSVQSGFLAYKVLHGDTRCYLGPLTCTDNLPGRQPLHSTVSTTVGSWAFAFAALHVWNSLPTDVIAANSLSTYRQLLKCFLFCKSYPDIVNWHYPSVVLAVAVPLRPL